MMRTAELKMAASIALAVSLVTLPIAVPAIRHVFAAAPTVVAQDTPVNPPAPSGPPREAPQSQG